MADDKMDMKATLHIDVKGTATIDRLMAQNAKLEKQIKALGGKSIIKDAIDPKTVKSYAREVNGLTKANFDWVKSLQMAGKFNAATFTELNTKINGAVANYKKLTNQKKSELLRDMKHAQAYAFMWNKAVIERQGMEEKLSTNMERIHADRLRRQMRAERDHSAQVSRLRRDALRGAYGGAVNFGQNALIYGGVAAGAAGYAAKSALSTRLKVDSAETNLRMFGGQSRDQVRDMRRGWGDKAAIQFGYSPDKMINAYTETLKAGIPETKGVARAVTETILKSATGLGLDVENTTRLAARAATLVADMKELDPNKIKSIMNAVAIGARDSGADANEIVAANRRGSGVLATSKMSMEQLSAFNAATISAGMPSGKAGTFMGFLVNDLVNAKNAHGQRAKDLGSASSMLGIGSRQNLAAKMASDPTETIQLILEKMGGMDEAKRAKVANLLGMREWRDELATLVQVRDDVARLMKAITDKSNKNFLDEASTERLKSLEGRWMSLSAAFKQLWEAVGSGLEESFGQVTDFFTEYMGNFDKDALKRQVEAFMQGMVKGLGFDSWGELLKSAFGDPKSIKDYSQQLFSFAKGFAAGLKTVVATVTSVLKAMAVAFGVDSANPEAMGKFVAELLGFSAALALMSPVLGVLAKITEYVVKIAVGLGLGAPAALVIGGAAAAAAAEGYTPDSAKKRPGETTEQYRQRRLQRKKELYHLQSGEGFNPADVHNMSYTSSSNRLGSQLDKFGAKFERASLMSGGGLGSISSGSSGLQYASIRTGGGGGGGLGRLLSGVGTPDALINSMPGQALPGFGVGAGGIIRRGSRGITGPSSIPSFTGGGGAADANLGAGLSGSSYLAARRARFAEEIKNDPNLALHLAAMQQTEGASKGGTIESLMNRADMQDKSLRQMLGYSADGKINPKSFYGPIRRGELGPVIAQMKRNPSQFAKFDAYTQQALAGGHVIGGYTDQGLATDPNGSARTGIKGFKINPRDGNEFQDWVGPGSSYGRGRAGAMNYRRMIEQHINDVPSAADAIKNVPASPSAAPMRGGFGGSNGNVAIHINGNSHDPEALAGLVQRRVDESMNWRMHDTESEYT